MKGKRIETQFLMIYAVRFVTRNRFDWEFCAPEHNRNRRELFGDIQYSSVLIGYFNEAQSGSVKNKTQQRAGERGFSRCTASPLAVLFCS